MKEACYTFEGTRMNDGTWEDESLETGSSYSYGDFQEYNGVITEEKKKELFILPEHMQGSDYSGDFTNKSNHRVFIKEFGEVEGVYDLYGGFGTFAIAIRLDVAESNTEIKDILEGLDNYSLIDEEDHSALEIESETEAFPEIISDIIREIDLEEYIPDCESILEDKEAIQLIGWDGIHDLALDWVHERYTAILCDDDNKLQPYIEDRLLIEHCKDLPLLINREWSCKDTRERYKVKLSAQ